MLCRHFQNGKCQLGDQCHFAHGDQQLRKENDPVPPQAQGNPQLFKTTGLTSNFKTAKCKYFDSGFCKNQMNCSFAHGDMDLRQFGFQQYQNIMIPQQMMTEQMMPSQIISQQLLTQQMPMEQNYYSSVNLQNGMPINTPPGFQAPQKNYDQQQFVVSQDQEINYQIMLQIISQLQNILVNDSDAIQKLMRASQLIQNNNLDDASNLVSEIMQDSKRTPQEIEIYNNIYQDYSKLFNQQQFQSQQQEMQYPQINDIMQNQQNQVIEQNILNNNEDSSNVWM